MMKDTNNKIIIYIFFVLLIIILTVGLTYAYFAAVIQNNESISTKGSSAKLSITYENDTENGTIIGEKIIPGWNETKKFTITGENTNKDNIDLTYDIVMIIIKNDFKSGELIYTLEGNNYKIENQPIQNTSQDSKFSLFPSNTTKPYFPGGTISQTHSYTLTIEYPNLPNTPQYSEGQEFSGYISIESTTQLKR